jgi:hypothetical protein
MRQYRERLIPLICCFGREAIDEFSSLPQSPIVLVACYLMLL